MVDVDDPAPDFTAPLAHGDDEVTPFTLADHLDEGPTVLAFFPGAFTGACTSEMNAFQRLLDDLGEAGGTLYGVSVDSPFSLNEFRAQEGLEFGLISDTNKELIAAYDVEMDFADLGYYGVAQRSVFVVDTDGVVTYRWVTEDPGVEPDYEDVLEAARDAS